MNGADAVVAMLKAYHVEYVFGLPGDTSIPLYEALRAASGSIRHVLARDERSASFMADVYARVSGRPGVCDAPSGAGATYLVPGLAEANQSSIPVIALTTDIPLAHAGRNVLTEMDQGALFRSVTKWRTTLARADGAPEALRKAFRQASSGRPGAVQITLPEDVLEQDAGAPAIFAEPACGEYPAYRAGPDPEMIARAAGHLVQAGRPVIVAGGGVVISRAWAELTDLAELLSIPVGTSINGQGSIDERHPLSLGVVGGNGARPYANDILNSADLVLFVGCKTDSVTTQNWTLPARNGAATVLHIDCDPTELGNNYATAVGIASDAKLALAQLGQTVRERTRPASAAPAREPWADFESLRNAWWESQLPMMRSDARPIKPQRVMDALIRLLPRETLIVADPGTATPFTSAFYASPAGRHIVIPRAYGGLGYAIPGVVGARLAKPDLPVIGLTGDGSFGMAAGELETIARLRLPVTLLQFNNGSFGWIKKLQQLYQDERYFSVDFSADSDYAAIARGFGLRGIRVEDPHELEPALRDALASDEPTFIDVVTESEVTETPPVHKWLTVL